MENWRHLQQSSSRGLVRLIATAGGGVCFFSFSLKGVYLNGIIDLLIYLNI